MKKSCFLLLVASSLTGCFTDAEYTKQMPISSLANLSGNNARSIKTAIDISPVFARVNDENPAYMYDFGNGNDAESISVEESKDKKPTFKINNLGGYNYTSKNISYDKDGFVKIAFDREEVPCINCVAELASETEIPSGFVGHSEEHTLTFGGKKVGLSYADFGMFKHSRTDEYINPEDNQTFVNYSPVIMDAGNYIIGSAIVDNNVVFNGKTLAVLNNQTDLTGDVKLTLKPENYADLEIKYNNGMNFNGTDLYFSDRSLSGNMNGNYYFNSDALDYFGENNRATEILGTYILNEQVKGDYNSIEGMFGVKNKDGIEMEFGCRNCLKERSPSLEVPM